MVDQSFGVETPPALVGYLCYYTTSPPCQALCNNLTTVVWKNFAVKKFSSTIKKFSSAAC